MPIASARAWIKASRGASREARLRARRAVRLADATDILHRRLTAPLALVAALRSAGDLVGATAAARAAQALAQEKGDRICAQRSQALIAELDSERSKKRSKRSLA
jgi:hypothetical protein